jgi:hypothetical protein
LGVGDDARRARRCLLTFVYDAGLARSPIAVRLLCYSDAGALSGRAW